MHITKKLALSFSLCLFALFSISAQGTLPDLTIESLGGKKINIKELGTNGKISVFSFWATWCKPCKKELNNIAEIYEEWQDNYNVQVIAVSIDDARTSTKVKTYVDGQSWDYTVLLDKNQDLKKSLNFQTVPFTLLVDQKGNIVDRHQGYVEGDEYTLEDKIKELAK